MVSHGLFCCWFYGFLLSCIIFEVIAAEGEGDPEPLPLIYVNHSGGVNDSSCWSGGATVPCLTFELGLEGLHNNRFGTLIIAPGEYTLDTSTYTEFHDMNDLSIQGMIEPGSFNKKPDVTIYCRQGVGLAFIKVDAISIGGVAFVGCGALHNSTSYNMNQESPEFLQIFVGIYFLYCSTLNITLVEVKETPGTGMVIYNTIGENIVHNSTFAGNMYQPLSGYSGGGGLSIEFSYCDITTVDCLKSDVSNVEPGYTDDASYSITESYFVNNYANITEKDAKTESFILPIGRYHVALGRGGGLSFYIIGSASRNKITVANCTIADNRAIWGAGMLVEFHDSAHSNAFHATGCVIRNNSVDFDSKHDKGTGGGGVRVAMFAFAKNNSVIAENLANFSGCTFERNTAYYGGGFSFYTSKINSSNSMQISSCNFTRNAARLGAGLDISLFHLSIEQDLPRVFLADCQFHFNHAFYTNLSGSLVGTGTVYVESIPVTFSGSTLLKDNLGTAFTITDTYIDLLENATLRFVGNRGRYGGALSLLGDAYIITSKDCLLEFIENSADFLGGAVYYYSSGERDLIGSGNCFFRYSDVFTPRENWTVQFNFESNSANGKRNAIYASTVLPCVHGGEDWNTDMGYKKTFCWNKLWTYDNKTGMAACKEQIKTAPNRYSVKSRYDLIPGERISLNASVFDDYGSAINNSALFLLKIMNDTDASFESKTSVNNDFTSHGHLQLYGSPKSTVNIQIETLAPVVIQDNFDVFFKDCPAGFRLSLQINGGCVCDDDYMGYIRCNESYFYSSILRTVWIGKVGNHSGLLVGGSPYISSISNDTYIPLPQDLDDLEGFFCNKSHSKGVLCGTCQDEYGVSVAAFEFIDTPCVKCHAVDGRVNWIYYILACFIPVLIFFIIIFTFGISVTFGPLNSFIFFAQVINSVTKIDADGMIPFRDGVAHLRSFYLFVYGIWNLKFFDQWLLFCISPKMNSLEVLLLGYARALFPLVLLICVFSGVYLYNRGTACMVLLCRPFHRCLARFRQFSNLGKSMIGGIAAFIMISYTQMTLISLLVITPATMYSPNGTTVTYVFYYAGDVFYNWKEGFRYIAPAVVFLCVFVVIPPFLFGYPTLLKLFSFLTCNKISLGNFYPSPKVQALLDEFHGCYKDGSDGGTDCRWFSSLYFVLRIALVAMYTYTGTWHLQYTVQIFFFLFVAFLFAMFRPYRKDWINVVDIGIFLLLAGICTISFFNLTNSRVGNRVNNNAIFIQELLMGIPLAYCIGYCCILLWKNMIRRGKKNKPRAKELLTQTLSEGRQQLLDSNDSDNDSRYTPTSILEDSTHVPGFLDFIEESGRSSTTPLTQPSISPQVMLPTTNSSINSATNESSRLVRNDEESKGFVRSTPWYKKRRSRSSRNRPAPHTTSTPYGATYH